MHKWVCHDHVPGHILLLYYLLAPLLILGWFFPLSDLFL